MIASKLAKALSLASILLTSGIVLADCYKVDTQLCASCIQFPPGTPAICHGLMGDRDCFDITCDPAVGCECPGVFHDMGQDSHPGLVKVTEVGDSGTDWTINGNTQCVFFFPCELDCFELGNVCQNTGGIQAWICADYQKVGGIKCTIEAASIQEPPGNLRVASN